MGRQSITGEEILRMIEEAGTFGKEESMSNPEAPKPIALNYTRQENIQTLGSNTQGIKLNTLE